MRESFFYFCKFSKKEYISKNTWERDTMEYPVRKMPGFLLKMTHR